MSARHSILLAALVAAAACSDDNGDGGSGPEPEGDVIVEDNDFEPSNLEVAPGATVVWAWAPGSTVHNVTFDDGEASDDQSSGTYQRSFETAGTFPYHCTFHGTATSGMRGVVSVTETPATGTDEDGDGGGDPDY
jgi:plastocyanin